MSEANAEIVRTIYEAFLRGDYEGALEFVGEEIEFTAPPDISGSGRTFRGHDGFRESVAEWVIAWDEYHFELRELIECGDEVFAEGRQRGRGKGSGIEVSESIYGVWTVRGGKAVRHRMLRDRDEALEAAGLRE